VMSCRALSITLLKLGLKCENILTIEEVSILFTWHEA
jgi:hypothetical protein